MITLVIPTRNRAAILERTAPSYFEQDLVDEVIVVDDGGTDATSRVLERIAGPYPGKRLVIVRNPARQGASQSRNIGVSRARNEYVLFCDDDELLEPGYAATCLRKLDEHGAAAVSGRRIYMRGGETTQQARARFGNGLRSTTFLRPLICEYVNGARFEGDLEVPFTNAVILTRKVLLERYPFDPYYARGNGYREETDYQMNLYTQGHKVIVTNDCHSYHLPLEQVRSGGQRTGELERIYWSVFYTRYFFRKYYAAYAARQRLAAPRWVALAAFSAFAVYRSYVRPVIYPLALRAASLAGRRTSAGRPAPAALGGGK